MPKRTEEKENKIYFEFLEFYEAAPINYIWFSREGSFAKLQEAVGKQPGEKWTWGHGCLPVYGGRLKKTTCRQILYPPAKWA